MEVITVQYLINGLLTVAVIVIGSLLKKKDEDQQQEIDIIRKAGIKTADVLSKLVGDMPREYVLKEDYKDDLREIKTILTRIEEKIDTKADRI